MSRLGVFTALLLTVLVAGVATPQAVGGTAGSTDRQLRRTAEIILLSAPRRLGRLAPALVDPKTQLLRTNTRASCRGLGTPVDRKYHVFRCVVTHAATRVVLRYTAVGRYGARLERLRA